MRASARGNQTIAKRDQPVGSDVSPGEIAQLVEHTTENRGVPGSSPGLAILKRPVNGTHTSRAIRAILGQGVWVIFSHRLPDTVAYMCAATRLLFVAALLSGTLLAPTSAAAGLSGLLCSTADLSGLDLRGRDLSGMNLNGLDLHGRDLSGAKLAGATIGGCLPQGKSSVSDLRWVNLDGVNLERADLTGATIKIGSLKGANLEGADLSGATVTMITNADGIRLAGATLSGASLTMLGGSNGAAAPASLPSGWTLRALSPGATPHVIGGVLAGPTADLSNADLSGFAMSGANLRGANLAGSKLDRSDLRSANLSEANLEGAHIESADFGSANLNLTSFRGAILINPVGSGITGTPVDLPWPWKLESGRLSSGNVFVPPSDGKLVNLDLRGMDLSGLNLSGATLTRVDLDGANLERADFTRAVFDDVKGCRITGLPLLPTMRMDLPDSLGLFATKVVNGCLVGAGVDMSGMDLTEFDLTGVSLYGSRLTGARLAGVRGSPKTSVDVGSVVPLVVRGRPATMPESWALLPVTGWDDTGDNYLIFTDSATLNLETMTRNLLQLIPSLKIDRTQVLRNVNLANRRLSGSSLTGVNMEGSDLSGTDLSNSTLVSVDAGGTSVPRDVVAAVASAKSTFGVKLFRAKLSGANLNQAKLKYAGLAGVMSGGIKGTPATLPSGWKLTVGYLVGPKANLSNANLQGASLSGIKLATATLSGATTCGLASRPSSLPTGWVSRGSCMIGPGANLKGANLSELDFGSANLYGTDLTGASISRAKLAKAKLTGVVSSGLIGTPASLPKGWRLVAGKLTKG